MKKANKALAALLALTMVTGSLAGCGSSNGSGKTETTPATEGTTETADAGASASGADTLVASSAHFEGKFSPFFAASAEDQHIVDMTQIGLVGADRQGAIVEKGIEGETRSYNGTDYTYYTASDLEMTQNDDGSVYYDVTIRDDLTFSDGTPITIDDVIFSMYVYCDPTYDGSATLYSQPILGMDEYREGMATLSSLIAAAGEDNTDSLFFQIHITVLNTKLQCRLMVIHIDIYMSIWRSQIFYCIDLSIDDQFGSKWQSCHSYRMIDRRHCSARRRSA